MTPDDSIPKLRLADLERSSPTARLRGLDPNWVRRLVEAGPDSWPPLLVDLSGRLADGWHRVAAAKALGLAALPAIRFYPQSEAEFLEAAALANRHGLPLAPGEQRAAGLRLLDLDPTMSDRRIARAVGVSPTTVGKWRRLHRGVQLGLLDTSGVRIGSDGKRYPLPSAPGPTRLAPRPRRARLLRIGHALRRLWRKALGLLRPRQDRPASPPASISG